MQVGRQPSHRRAVFSLTHNLDVQGAFQDDADAGAQCRMVVGQQYADGLARLAHGASFSLTSNHPATGGAR